MPPPSGPTPKSPIEVLPSMLHAVFIQTANVFSDPRKNNPRAVVSTNAMIRLGIPAVIDRFQYALDCLEVEILRAKAAFRRDLEVIRQRAAEETKAVAEREAQEARAKALAEENAAREKQEKEEKEARVKAAADQVAAAIKAEEERKNQKLNSGLTDNAVNRQSTNTKMVSNVQTPPPVSATFVGEDINMLFNESPFGRNNHKSAAVVRNNANAFPPNNTPYSSLKGGPIPTMPTYKSHAQSVASSGGSNSGGGGGGGGSGTGIGMDSYPDHYGMWHEAMWDV